jgi:transcription elongation factor GreA
MDKILLTQAGYDEIKARYDYLCGPGRLEMSEKIRVAREFGDLSENAEYDAAKEEQAFLEKEIKELNEKLLHSEIIDESNLDGKVVRVGSTVKILYVEDDEKTEYQILDSVEANKNENVISNTSPMGKVLLGKKKGADVEVDAPNGKIKIRILGIK